MELVARSSGRRLPPGRPGGLNLLLSSLVPQVMGVRAVPSSGWRAADPPAQAALRVRVALAALTIYNIYLQHRCLPVPGPHSPPRRLSCSRALRPPPTGSLRRASPRGSPPRARRSPPRRRPPLSEHSRSPPERSYPSPTTLHRRGGSSGTLSVKAQRG